MTESLPINIFAQASLPLLPFFLTKHDTHHHALQKTRARVSSHHHGRLRERVWRRQSTALTILDQLYTLDTRSNVRTWLSTARLYPLTEESNMPKALLPVVNQPMISYQLAWLEDSGVTGQKPESAPIIFHCQAHMDNDLNQSSLVS